MIDDASAAASSQVKPVFLSPHNATSHGFATSRHFREFARRSGLPLLRIGKTVLVRVSDIETLFARPNASESSSVAEEHQELSSPDDVLARIGRRRAAKPIVAAAAAH